ncbi:hypothetical protein [Alkalimonas amylolytica]|uniref:hypothetical protein n=1 Tax=Alkalimonas amylolytica TaxID=152573 RepID=UPI001114E0AD|nr:hypothetical protein [Alkalimonas amylolytica]
MKEQSLIKYQGGFPFGLETLVFDESDVAGKMIFKSELQGCKALYASAVFKELCEAHSLTGVLFDENLLNIF